jgi:ubiquinone/menaquinone biosynthesis C-methylase UbiE
MTVNKNEIINQQRESWNNFSAGWKKWDSTTMQFLKPFGDEIIQRLALQSNFNVLDVASGTGEPGLSIAEIVNEGKVIGIDLSEKMLKTAQEHAVARTINNYHTQTSDVSELPFSDQSFDAISCRMGFMFFPDIEATLKEMRRVLKPGSRLAASVWVKPENNFWITVAMGTISQALDLPPPPADAPSMFRCAAPDFMTAHFEKAGFKNISATELNSALSMDPETYWEMTTEVAAPIVAAMNNADDETKQKIKDEVFRKIDEKFPDGNINMQATALIISAEA